MEGSKEEKRGGDVDLVGNLVCEGDDLVLRSSSRKGERGG